MKIGEGMRDGPGAFARPLLWAPPGGPFSPPPVLLGPGKIRRLAFFTRLIESPCCSMLRIHRVVTSMHGEKRTAFESVTFRAAFQLRLGPCNATAGIEANERNNSGAKLDIIQKMVELRDRRAPLAILLPVELHWILLPQLLHFVSRLQILLHFLGPGIRSNATMQSIR